MEKVIAVVVTHNRLKLLSECIDALRQQTTQPDAILVVNNASTDGTLQWLESQNDLIVINQNNVGSSGGFNTGISWAFKNGYSWIWCMDDDGYPKEDALEKILEPETEQLCLRNCAVLNKDNKKTFVWKTQHYQHIDQVETPIIKGIAHPFNGTLIHRNIVERVGVPISQLFLWGDESEYYYRIVRKNKIPVCTVTGSIHYHPAAAFNYKNDWEYAKTWKIYYYVRNRFHIHKSKFNNGIMSLMTYLFFLIGLAASILVFQKTDKFKKLSFILWPATHAILNNFNENPQKILHRLNPGEVQVTKKQALDYYKRIRLLFLHPLEFFRPAKMANV